MEKKQEYSAVDLLAKEIAKAADFNAHKYEYDKTFISFIVKNNTGVSSTLTDGEKSQLTECDSDWYYVRINGNFYKLECKNSNFEIDTEVKVTVPCNNWNKMFINFKQGTNGKYKRWVRPSDWLPLPSKVERNEMYFLVRGQRDSLSSDDLIFSIYLDYYDINNSATVDWGDGSAIETINGSGYHKIKDTNWHWVKITYTEIDNLPLCYMYDYCGTCVEIISGGYAGFYLNNPDNYCNTLEHIVCGYFNCNFSYYGLHNLQCIEIVPAYNNTISSGLIYGNGCYDLVIHDTVKKMSTAVVDWSALKYVNLNKLTEMISFGHCYNVEEIYAPNCIHIPNHCLGVYYQSGVPNLKKITVKTGCLIEDEWLKRATWVEINYV